MELVGYEDVEARSSDALVSWVVHKIESRNLDIDTYIVQNLRKFVDTLQDLSNSNEIEQRLIKYAKENKLAGCSADENRLCVWGEEELC